MKGEVSEYNENQRTSGPMGTTKGVGVRSGLSSHKQISGGHDAIGGGHGQGQRPTGKITGRSGTHNGHRYSTS